MTDNLPPLPTPARITAVQFCDDGLWFNADQMQAYARAAIAQAQSLPALNALSKRRISDAIREAYDLGYSDARNAGARSGDNAPGYKGRDIEEDHGGALLSALNAQIAASPQPKETP